MAQEKIDATTSFQDDQRNPYLGELERAGQEVAEIRALIPPTGTPGEQRKATNAIVRQRLADASDLSVVKLAMAYDHQLSRKELLKRISEQKDMSLPALYYLVRIVRGIVPPGAGRKNEEELVHYAFQTAERTVPLMPQNEIESFLEVEGFDSDNKSGFIVNTLSLRPDARIIADRLIANQPVSANAEMVERTVQEAERLRARRLQKPI